jgi:hypothetical protein
MRQLADPLPTETVLLRQPGNERDDLSAYDVRWRTFRSSSGVRVIQLGDGLGPGVVVFPKLPKLLNQEDALSAPC